MFKVNNKDTRRTKDTSVTGGNNDFVENCLALQ